MTLLMTVKQPLQTIIFVSKAVFVCLKSYKYWGQF
ncbi:hypothetical protein PMJEKBHI_00690 [Lacticaseibacillus rhamnosus]|nr:hypothetical protein BN934_02149 [Lacticaseibacillus rhamnosus]SSA27768.1 hypothetical protein PMJEKBHI_00690 [Lacticaseibacillus rhamnosus]VEF29601.1 Uncharacterised protein [Lacticaseibacillus rhamnosus]VEF60886.1 Uncharacterised protein [Lacticaseibacillus rhamnosus]VTU49783.1 hypothetical protein AMBR_JPGBJEAN_00564 [Lacticaseibacillus rhamnosus]